MLMKFLLLVYLIQAYSKYLCPDYKGFKTWVRARDPKTKIIRWSATIGVAHTIPPEDATLSCYWEPIDPSKNLARPQEIPLPIIRKGSPTPKVETDKPRKEVRRARKSPSPDKACADGKCPLDNREHREEKSSLPDKDCADGKCALHKQVGKSHSRSPEGLRVEIVPRRVAFEAQVSVPTIKVDRQFVCASSLLALEKLDFAKVRAEGLNVAYDDGTNVLLVDWLKMMKVVFSQEFGFFVADGNYLYLSRLRKSQKRVYKFAGNLIGLSYLFKHPIGISLTEKMYGTITEGNSNSVAATVMSHGFKEVLPQSGLDPVAVGQVVLR